MFEYVHNFLVPVSFVTYIIYTKEAPPAEKCIVLLPVPCFSILNVLLMLPSFHLPYQVY